LDTVDATGNDIQAAQVAPVVIAAARPIRYYCD
jgi:hypothetical protein